MTLKPTKLMLAIAAIGTLASGCSTFNPMDKDAKVLREEGMKDILDEINEEITAQTEREMWEPYQGFEQVPLDAPKGDVNVKASATPMNILLQEIADKYDYAIGFSDTVVPEYPVSVSFRNFTPEEAIRRIAEVAGVAVVFDKDKRQVTVSDVATYTYRIPPNVMSKIKSKYKVGGDTSGSGSSGGSSGGATGGQGLSGEFTIEGEDKMGDESLPEAFKRIAGAAAQVDVVPETGTVTVRGSAQVLSRMTTYINSLVKDATTQVAIEASLVEVQLTNGFERGVNWSKVLSSKGIDYTLNSFSPALNGADGQFSFFWTNSANTTSVISAIRRFTDVKVVSQPRLLLMNHTPSTLFAGKQIPFLGKLEVQTDQTGFQNTTGEVQYAIDGLSLSVTAHAISKDNIEITLVPTINRVDQLVQFPLGDNGQLTAPETTTRQTAMRVMSDGKGTLVLGGIRQRQDTRNSAGLIPIFGETAASDDAASELVILLRARMIPAPHYNPLVAESL